MWQYILLLQVFSLLQIRCDGEYPKGHMKRLGEQRPPEIITEQIVEDLHPIEFWERFVKQEKPVLFPGAAKNSEYVCQIKVVEISRSLFQNSGTILWL